VVIATLLVTALLGAFAVQVHIQNALESVLPAGDRAVAFYQEVRRQFGSDDVGVVGMLGSEVFSPDALTKIARVTAALGKLPGVQSVLSITNAKDVAADVFNPPPLPPKIPPPAREVEALRAQLPSVRLYRENSASPGGRGAAITVFFEPLSDARYAALGLDERIAGILAA